MKSLKLAAIRVAAASVRGWGRLGDIGQVGLMMSIVFVVSVLYFKVTAPVPVVPTSGAKWTFVGHEAGPSKARLVKVEAIDAPGGSWVKRTVIRGKLSAPAAIGFEPYLAVAELRQAYSK